jgi:peptide/nickel transport system permease protein
VASGGDSGVPVEDKSSAYPVRLLTKESGDAGIDARLHLFGVAPSGHIFLLGTDGLGRDQFSRLLYGGRISLFAGLLAAFFSLGVGLLLGSAAGFHGGWIDEIIMRGAELFLALPWLYCLLAIRAFLPLHLSQGQVFLTVVLVIGLRGWARPARLIRGVVLSAKEREYVLAARAFGSRGVCLLRRHILPHTYGILLTQAAILIPQYVLAEVTLSFLGLGVGEPSPTWGNMLAGLQRYSVLASYWWMCFPAVILIPIFFSYNVLGDMLHERLFIQQGRVRAIPDTVLVEGRS